MQRQRFVADHVRCGVDAIADSAHRLHRRKTSTYEVEEELVLTLREVLLDLLDGVDDPVQAHEADDVPRDSAGQRHDEILGPLLKRRIPGEKEEVGVSDRRGNGK